MHEPVVVIFTPEREIPEGEMPAFHWETADSPDGPWEPGEWGRYLRVVPDEPGTVEIRRRDHAEQILREGRNAT